MGAHTGMGVAAAVGRGVAVAARVGNGVAGIAVAVGVQVGTGVRVSAMGVGAVVLAGAVGDVDWHPISTKSATRISSKCLWCFMIPFLPMLR